MSCRTGNYINGKWVWSRNGKTIASINPARSHEVVGEVPDSDCEDLNEAVTAAQNAFAMWSGMSPVERGAFLQKAAEILEKRLEDIAVTATREMGKILPETRGEVLRGAAILRYFAQEGLRQMGELLPSPDRKNFLFSKRVPLGVVGVITPWNFPIAIPLWKVAPALVYGNTVVLKPAAETGVTACKIAEVFEEAGLPKGVFNLVNGKGSVVGSGLVEHPGVIAITFTGSNEVGKRVAFGAVARGAKYQLEMGGKNPVIVLEDADLERAAELTVQGALKQTGQRCTATSRVYVHHAVYDEFKERLLQKIASIKIGDGLLPGVQMGPLVSGSQLERVLDFVEKGIREGATLLYGGGRLQSEEYRDGFFVKPTVFENVTNDMTIAKEEIFGPVLCLSKVDGFEEAISLANDSRYGLSASLFTRDLPRSLTFIDRIEAGMVQINGETGGAEPQAPFGGMKDSSSHSREQGQAAKEFFTTWKTVAIHPGSL